MLSLIKKRLFNRFDDAWARCELLSKLDLLLVECLYKFQVDKNAQFTTFYLHCVQLRLISYSRDINYKFFNYDFISLDEHINEDIPTYRINVIEDTHSDPHEKIILEEKWKIFLSSYTNWYRDVFLLKKEGYSAKEIAMIVNKSPNTVRNVLNNGKKLWDTLTIIDENS